MDCKHFTDNLLEAGIDEVARCCGRSNICGNCNYVRDTLEETPYIRDSKS